MKKGQHVLIIGKVWIEPASSAAGSRTLQLIELLLSEGHRVSFATATADSPHKADLGALNIASYKIELNNASFDTFIKMLDPDIVVFDRFVTEEQFGWRVAEHCPNALRILDTIDLHCLRDARNRALKDKRAFDRSDLFNDIAKRELASIYRCDLSLMISEVEMDLLQNYFKVNARLLHYIPFVSDPLSGDEIQDWLGFEEREHFLTIGNFLHEPNWDSVLYLKEEIWPRIRKKIPKAQMHVYGAYPSQKVFQLHNDKEGFLIKGRAEHVATVMKQARICLAPLRFGAGIKGKLYDAMIYGLPSVTTPIGAESMHGNLPWNGLIADTTEALAEAAVNLYLDEHIWKLAQEKGKTIINHFFSKAVHANKFINAINVIREDLSKHRHDNFTGAMLMHHSIAASKYMALWIETKNKIQ